MLSGIWTLQWKSKYIYSKNLIRRFSKADAWNVGGWLFVSATSPILPPFFSSDSTVYLSSQLCWRHNTQQPSWEPVWNDCPAPPTFVYVFQETRVRCGGLVDIGGWSEVGASLKSDKLLKIAFTQPFLFGHTCHIWMWSGNKSAVAEGSAPRVVPHITQTPHLLHLSSSSSSSSGGSANTLLIPTPQLISLRGTRSWWCWVPMLSGRPSDRNVPHQISGFKGIIGL